MFANTATRFSTMLNEQFPMRWNENKHSYVQRLLAHVSDIDDPRKRHKLLVMAVVYTWLLLPGYVETVYESARKVHAKFADPSEWLNFVDDVAVMTSSHIRQEDKTDQEAILEHITSNTGTKPTGRFSVSMLSCRIRLALDASMRTNNPYDSIAARNALENASGVAYAFPRKRPRDETSSLENIIKKHKEENAQLVEHSSLLAHTAADFINQLEDCKTANAHLQSQVANLQADNANLREVCIARQQADIAHLVECNNTLFAKIEHAKSFLEVSPTNY